MTYSQKQYMHMLFEKHGNMVLLDAPYTKMRNKTRHKCGKCKHKWSTTPDSILRQGSACPKCNGREADRKTTKQYKEEVAFKSNGSVIVKGKYVNNHTKITHKCTVCDNVYDCVPNRFSCVSCRITKSTKTQEKYEAEVFNMFKNDITVTEKYVSTKTKIDHFCNNCNSSWKAWPVHILRGVGCPNCCVGGNPYKKFKMGNRTVLIQGHEDIVLKHLLKTYSYKDIAVFSDKTVPRVPYGKGKNHHPDIFIKKLNTLIEVKGNASIGMVSYHNAKTKDARIKLFKSVQNKAKAAIKSGYNYRLFLVQPNHNVKELPENWQHLSYAKFRKLWLDIKKSNS